MIFGRHPTVIAAAIRALILVGIAYGLRISQDQLVATMLAVEAILALLVHGQVTPVGDPRLPVGTPVNSGTATVTGPPPVPTVDVKP